MISEFRMIEILEDLHDEPKLCIPQLNAKIVLFRATEAAHPDVDEWTLIGIIAEAMDFDPPMPLVMIPQLGGPKFRDLPWEGVLESVELWSDQRFEFLRILEEFHGRQWWLSGDWETVQDRIDDMHHKLIEIEMIFDECTRLQNGFAPRDFMNVYRERLLTSKLPQTRMECGIGTTCQLFSEERSTTYESAMSENQWMNSDRDFVAGFHIPAHPCLCSFPQGGCEHEHGMIVVEDPYDAETLAFARVTARAGQWNARVYVKRSGEVRSILVEHVHGSTGEWSPVLGTRSSQGGLISICATDYIPRSIDGLESTDEETMSRVTAAVTHYGTGFSVNVPQWSVWGVSCRVDADNAITAIALELIDLEAS